MTLLHKLQFRLYQFLRGDRILEDQQRIIAALEEINGRTAAALTRKVQELQAIRSKLDEAREVLE